MLELQGLHISHSGSVVWVRLQPSQGVQVLQLLVIISHPLPPVGNTKVLDTTGLADFFTRTTDYACHAVFPALEKIAETLVITTAASRISQ
jgi:hypothetical protein